MGIGEALIEASWRTDLRNFGRRGWRLLPAAVCTAFVVGSCGPQRQNDILAEKVATDLIAPDRAYLDSSDGADWPGYGRTFGEQHYSPLNHINRDNIAQLGLSWYMDLGPENSTSQPIAVDGIVYFSTGYSIIHAVDAKTGELVWRYDPEAAAKAGLNLRLGWGARGIAWWNGRIYTGTQDGRLIALDAATGEKVWSQQTFDPESARYITGAPRAFGGLVVIGHGGDTGPVRGYVTAYDAETGEEKWRFYTVPGNPEDGFENAAMEMAAETWSGEWWKFGGGGTVWNAMAYDPESDTLYLGTGNGYPYNHRLRSDGEGDNLFLCSIVALEGATGAYKWHYQINPGETWDYNAAMDIELADLTISGKTRQVLITAPKNGFFYVIDRTDGELISAEKFARVSWASRIDLETGRPVEAANARYPDGKSFELWPSAMGAHSWMPMAYSPKVGLAFIPVIELGAIVSDAGLNLDQWTVPADRSLDETMISDAAIDDPLQATGALVAWDPIRQQEAWRIDQPTLANGGVLATSGDLVFQGTVEGNFTAYSAVSGQTLWTYDVGAPMIGAPISYSVEGEQYVSVLTGLGNSPANMGAFMPKYDLDPRSQARRLLTFSIDGSAVLPPEIAETTPFLDDPDFESNHRLAEKGAGVFGRHCAVCHGYGAISGSHAPDLRRSGIVLTEDAFEEVVLNGALEARGMPAFAELSDTDVESLRQYIRKQANQARETKAPAQ